MTSQYNVSVEYHRLDVEHANARVSVRGDSIVLFAEAYGKSSGPHPNWTDLQLYAVNANNPADKYHVYSNVQAEFATTPELVLKDGDWDVTAIAKSAQADSKWCRLYITTEPTRT